MQNLDFPSVTGFVLARNIIYDNQKCVFTNGDYIFINKSHIVSFQKKFFGKFPAPSASDVSGTIFYVETTAHSAGYGLQVTCAYLEDLLKASGASR